MRRSPIDHKSTRLWLIDIMVAQQFQLIEHEQKAGRIAAGINAIELPHVEHVSGASARHVVCCTSRGTNSFVEPCPGCRNGLSLCRRGGATSRQIMRKICPIRRRQIYFSAVFTAKPVADKNHTGRRRSHRKTAIGRLNDAGKVAPVAANGIVATAIQLAAT